MTRKKLEIVMSIIFLFSIFITTCVFLPHSATTNSIVLGGSGFFGKNKEKKTEEQQQDSDVIDLTDKKVVIDVGHGGFDPGKQSKDGINEKDINLAISLKLKEILENKGIQVLMTRTDDTGLYSENDSNKKAADMKARCAIINESNADIVVSIHQNSFQSSAIKGAQVFYYKHSADGKKLAQIMQNALKNGLDPDNNRVEKSDTSYYMLVHTDIPTVIAECGFLSNPDEAAKLNSEEYQQKVAEALCNGIIEYLTHA